MVSPTPNKGYTYPAHGGAVNAWDSPLNFDFDTIDLNVGGTYNITLGSTIAAATYNSTNATIPSTAAAITIPTSLANNLHYAVSGTIAASMNLTFPSAFAGIVDITNSSSGNFLLTTSVSGSTATATNVGGGSHVFVSDQTTMLLGNANNVQSYLGNPNGNVAGTAATVSGSLADEIWDATNQILYFCTTTGSSATAVWSQPTATVNRGFDTAINLELSVTHTGGNLLQLALKTAAGADPTAADPVICKFQTLSGSNTTGATTSVSITAALSMTTNAAGASLGSVANTPFRIWFALFNNTGTAVLAMRNCSTTLGTLPLAEYGVDSTSSISGAATSAGVWYTPNGTTLANCAYRIIGYCEYTAGLATAGTYTSDPTNVVVFGPGIKKAGDVVQTRTASSTTSTSTASNTFVTPANAVSIAIIPSSTVNLIKVSLIINTNQTGSDITSFLQILRGASLIGIPIIWKATANGTGQFTPISVSCLDAPASTSSQTYTYQIHTTSSFPLWAPPASTGSFIQVEEIMG